MNSIVLGLHVLFASMLVGPQVLLFLAVIPATWLIPDESLRRNVTRVVTQRFAWLASIAIGGLLLTGLYQLSAVVCPDVRDQMMDYRFGVLFSVKMLAFLVLLTSIILHGAIYGRRIRLMSEAVERGEAEPGQLEQARRNSLMFSMFILVLSVAVLFMGAALGNHDYSCQPLA